MDQKYTGYLFVFFTGAEETKEDEQVYFSVSRDGFHWYDLNAGRPILQSSVGEKGVRDPFIVKSVLDGRYRIIATDLQICGNKNWDEAAYHGSTKLVLWESEDLIHWGEPRLWETGIKGAGCAWAPEVIFDDSQNEYMVFWASMTESEDGSLKQKIYKSRTKDFTDFSKPELYIEKESHIIDTTFIKSGDRYYRFSKDEINAVIKMESGNTLDNHSFQEIDSEVLRNLSGVEGPEIFRLNDENRWCLIADEVDKGSGYLPMVTEDLDSGSFRILSREEYDFGLLKKRHGSILNLTEEEISRLEKAEADIFLQ